jgi:hypothetical protein
LQNLSAAFRHADFYLLVDHSEAHEIADEQNSDVKVRIVGKDGYNAQLLCFSPDQPAPQVLFLKFDAPGESPPLVGLDPASLRVIPGKPPSWMIFGNDFLFFGLERNRIDPPPPWGWPSGVGAAGKPGVWLMPVSQLETALTAQKQAGIPQDAQPEQNRKDLLDTPGTLGNGPPLYRGIPPGRIGSANAMTNSRTP